MLRVLDPSPPVPPPGEHELPSDDGEPMENDEHRQQMNLLITSLKLAWAGRHDYFVGGNMFVYFSETQVKNNDFRGPDVFVVLDTTDRRRKCWVAWGEDGKLPNVVIELTCPTTAAVDRGEKKLIYERRWRTPEYYVFDPDTKQLEGWALDSRTHRYRAMQPDARGDLPCEQLGLRVGVRQGVYERVDQLWLRFIDAEGSPLPTPEEWARAASAVADDERRRADDERRRADDERRRADDAQRRADDERRRADDERRRAETAEARIRELEARSGKR